MSQTYRFRSLEISKDEQTQGERVDENMNVFDVGETKTIDFRLRSGVRQCFQYSHFITAWYGSEDNKSIIKLFFSTHLVTIKGYCLDNLYNHLLEHAIKSIQEQDERYISIVKENAVFVSDIGIQWKKETDSDKKLD
ncbi:MAG: hypothetical protein CML04_02025 [Pseudozobellia sp.]|nr:hypothetical protein [Pseudozobellia sp.]MBG48960.1 hypothetical protein [Pseudozobellia sp.]|tara:strand:+ start:235 stop:645 length:411 start_codon:yes stop_codon:yes gene_type:complete